MSRVEILSPEGLRCDGRRWNELRQFKCRTSNRSWADGSSYVENGNTKILCTVQGPQEPSKRGKILNDRASVNTNLYIAPFSTTDRRVRPRNDRRIQEITTAIDNVFENAIETQLHPRSQIHISLEVLSQDGGVLHSCINAATLALIDAGIPMVDYVCAASAGLYGTECILDLNNLEECDIPWITVATIGNSDQVALLQLETKIHSDTLEKSLAVAISGCQYTKALLDATIRHSS